MQHPMRSSRESRLTPVIDDVSEVRGDHGRGGFGRSGPARWHAAQTTATARTADQNSAQKWCLAKIIAHARVANYLQFVQRLLNRVKWCK